jgi:hypothetical protein
VREIAERVAIALGTAALARQQGVEVRRQPGELARQLEAERFARAGFDFANLALDAAYRGEDPAQEQRECDHEENREAEEPAQELAAVALQLSFVRSEVRGHAEDEIATLARLDLPFDAG